MSIEEAAVTEPEGLDLETESIEEDEDEDALGGGGGAKPWDATKIRITTKSFTLREIVEQIAEKEVDLAPDFQRAYVWKARQRTRLVESILLGIPLPAFYFNQDEHGAYQVVDGVQRLTTISDFMADKHALGREDLEYLIDLGGKNFTAMDKVLRRRIQATQIVVHVIEPQTPSEVKYDIFSRVNTLGSPLSAQEIRHAMSKVRSRSFLKELVEVPAFTRATDKWFVRRLPGGKHVVDDRRMMDRELALRFCAFRITPLAEYRGFESLDAFLLDVTRRLDGATSRFPALEPLRDEDLARLKADFTRAMTNAADILANRSFRRLQPGRRGPINRALFEAQGLAFCDHELAALTPRKAELVGGLKALFEDSKYVDAVTRGTGSMESVRLRLERTRLAVERALR